MAKTGLEYIKVGKVASGTKSTDIAYTDQRYIGTSAGFTGTMTANDVKDYGDDRTVETDVSVTGCTFSWEKNDLKADDKAYLLGHEVENDYELTSDTDIVTGKTYYTRSGSGTSESPYVYTAVDEPVKANIGTYYEVTATEVITNVNDVPPYFGIGVVGKSMRRGQNVFVAKFYFKTQWKEPNDEHTTATDTTTFAHDTIEGNGFYLEDGVLKSEKEFSTLSAAKTWIDGKLGVSA